MKLCGRILPGSFKCLGSFNQIGVKRTGRDNGSQGGLPTGSDSQVEVRKDKLALGGER